MANKQYGVGTLGSCRPPGEFVATSLKQEPPARINAGWQEDPGPSLITALSRELAWLAQELLDTSQIDLIVIARSPHKKAAWLEKLAQAGTYIFPNKPIIANPISIRKFERAVTGYAVDYMSQEINQ